MIKWLRNLFDPVGTMPTWKPIAASPRDQFNEKIRWRGEIYCVECGSTLERITITREEEHITYDPQTGTKIVPKPTRGLMVCSYSEPGPYTWMYKPDFREYYKDMKPSKHAMFYVDSPPLDE